jgi:nucleotide-binding universal stress UspA family protein
MTLLITYSNTLEGSAALDHGRAVADRLDIPVVVFDLDRQSHEADRRVEPPAGVAREGEPWFGPAHTAPSAVEDLLDTAQELDVEAIVVGVRRRSAVGKLIMGSQAQRLILDAPMPVLTVKAKAAGE